MTSKGKTTYRANFAGPWGPRGTLITRQTLSPTEERYVRIGVLVEVEPEPAKKTKKSAEPDPGPPTAEFPYVSGDPGVAGGDGFAD